jgi:hypothetical protein
MNCPHCGKTMDFDGFDNFCEKCGYIESDQEEFINDFEGDYNEYHPDETEEEFWGHEDMEDNK